MSIYLYQRVCVVSLCKQAVSVLYIIMAPLSLLRLPSVCPPKLSPPARVVLLITTIIINITITTVDFEAWIIDDALVVARVSSDELMTSVRATAVGHSQLASVLYTMMIRDNSTKKNGLSAFATPLWWCIHNETVEKEIEKKKESSDLFPSTSCKWGDDRGQSTSETITLPICRPRFHFPYSRHRYTLIRHWLKHAIDAYVAINNFSLVAYIAIPLFLVLNIHAGLSIKIVSELYCIKLILYYLRHDFVPLFLFYAPFFFCFLLFLF